MVQVIPKKLVPQKVRFKNLLPWLSLLLVVIVILIYLIFVLQVNRARVSLEELKADLGQAQTKEQLELEKTILIYKRKIDDVALLLESRQRSLDIFEFLEEFVHPNLYFSSLSMNLNTGKVILKGVSNDFKSLGQQIFVFEREPFIEKAELSKVSLFEEGKINFDIELSLSPKDSEQPR